MLPSAGGSAPSSGILSQYICKHNMQDVLCTKTQRNKQHNRNKAAACVGCCCVLHAHDLVGTGCAVVVGPTAYSHACATWMLYVLCTSAAAQTDQSSHIPTCILDARGLTDFSWGNICLRLSSLMRPRFRAWCAA